MISSFNKYFFRTKKSKNNNVKSNGITLIALVITIIVLLILLGVTITIITNDNGLLVKAQEAKKVSDETATVELINFAQLDYEAEIRSNPNTNKATAMANAIQKAFNDNSIDVISEGNSFKFEINGTTYKIKPDGTIKEIMLTTGLYGKLELDGTLKLKATSTTEDGYNSIYEGVLKNCTDNKEKIKKIIIEEPIAPNKISFYQLTKLESIENISYLHTENMTNMQGMFDSCASLKTIDVSSFDTSGVLSMSGMFGSCSALTKVNANNLDTSKVTSMSGMFNGCYNLQEVNINGFDLSCVTDCSAMFNSCNALTTLDLSTWVNTSGVGNMNAMFQLSVAHELTELNLGKNFTIGSSTTYNNILNNVKRNIHIICNSDTAEKLGSSFTNVTII